jgi:raffinose/stachyose/melibiose transport system substrate-binding protein
MQNNAKIKKAGLIPLIQTYGDSWTAQLLILADSFNVQTASPYFAALFASNRVKISKVPAAIAGFQYLADIHKAGYLNKDFATAKLADGLKYLISGKGVHYPMLSFVATDLDKIDPTLADNIGIFAEPGLSAKSNGLTIWMPNALFIPTTTKHLLTAQNFLSFAMSKKAICAMNAVVAPSGPYLLKGPNLPKFSVAVGSGIKSALGGATAYDLDVARESQRLGLPGWGQLPG